jgi:hypothetical protein
MADIAQVLATGGTALVSAAAGAGLAYWLGALNRRHQEAREDRTRWYEKRLQAYTELSAVAFQGLALSKQSLEEASFEENLAHMGAVAKAFSLIRLVGSPEVIKRAAIVTDVALHHIHHRGEPSRWDYAEAVNAFEAAAREDLGHPEPFKQTAPLRGMRLPAHPRAYYE